MLTHYGPVAAEAVSRECKKLPQSPRRRPRTRHKREKKKTLHWPVSPLPRPPPQPPGPPPIPEGTDDDDWTDDDDDHSEDPYPCPSGWDNVWEDYLATYGENFDVLCDPDSVYKEPE